MDIKLKNISDSVISKFISGFFIWLIVPVGLFSLWHFTINDSHGDSFRENFYSTASFRSMLFTSMNEINKYGVVYKSEENIKKGNAVSKEDLEEYISNHNITNNDEITTEQKLREQEIYKQGLITEQLLEFKDLKTNLDNYINMKYVLLNRKNGQVISNIKSLENTENEINKGITSIKNSKVNFYIKGDETYSSIPEMNIFYGSDRFGSEYELYISINSPLLTGDDFYDREKHFIQTKATAKIVIIVLCISLILALVGFGFLLLLTGKRDSLGNVKMKQVDSIYNDLHTFFVALAAFLSMFVSVQSNSHHSVGVVWLFIVLSIDVFIGLSYILSMTRHFRNKTLFTNTLIYAIFKMGYNYMKIAFTTKAFRPIIIVLFWVYGGINGILGMILYNHLETYGDFEKVFITLVIGAFNIIATFIVVRWLYSMTRIFQWVGDISKGIFESEPDIESMPVTFAVFAQNIKSIRSGLKNAVNEAVKGERLKTELITNVSHDLKTPLTSIINYVDLLKKEDINNEKAKEYLDVLDEKSGRLKLLIENLLEASKAATGNIVVNRENVDLYALVRQADGEYEDRFESAFLDVRIKDPEEVVMVNGDGKLMWRIIDNLFSNISKYSLKSSRVYIDIEKDENYGIIVMKNISANPLDIPPERLIERFVRGDQARSSEGHGLGLSIAKSLAQVQDGNLDIHIDGDLFKVVINIPVCK